MTIPTFQGVSTNTGKGNTITVNVPSGIQENELLMAVMTFEKGSTINITPDAAGWDLIERTDYSNDVGMASYERIATASEPSTYTFSVNGSPKWCSAGVRVSGVYTTTPIGANLGQFGESSTSVVAPSITTENPDRLVFTLYTNKKAATYTDITNEEWDAPNAVEGMPSNAGGWFQQASAGATGDQTATASEAEVWCAQQVAVRPASIDDSDDLSSSFEVAEALTPGSASLPSSFTIQKADSEALSSSVTVRKEDSADLSSSVTVRKSDSEALSSSFTIRKSDSEDLSSSVTVRNVGAADLSSSITVQKSASQNLSSSVTLRYDSELGHGLIGLWHLNEGSGDSLEDSSPVGTDGVRSGAGWTDGKYSKALNFDGQDDYGKVLHNDILDEIDELTCTAWVYKTAFVSPADFEDIVNKMEAYHGAYIDDNKKVCFAYHDGTQWQTFCSLVDFPLDEWVFLAATQEADGSNTKITLYRNGNLDRQDTITGRPTSTTADLYFGNRSTNDYPFLGIIDEVRLYHRVLSQDEIRALMNSNAHGPSLSTSVTVRNVGSEDLSSNFTVRTPGSDDLSSSVTLRKEDSEDLSSSVTIQKSDSKSLSSSLTIQKSDSIGLSSSVTVRQPGADDLSSSFTCRKSDSEDLSSSVTIRKSDSEALSSSFTVRQPGSKDLSSSVTLQKENSADLSSSVTVVQSGSNDLSSSVTVRQPGSADLSSSITVRKSAEGDLSSSFTIRKSDSEALSSSITLQKEDSAGLSSSVTVQKSDSADLSSSVTVRKSDSESLSSSFTVQKSASEALSSSVTVRNVGSADLSSSFSIPIHAADDLSSSFTVAQDYADLSCSFTIQTWESASLSSSFKIQEYYIRTVTCLPVRVQRSGAMVTELRCDWHDDADLSITEYTCQLYTRGPAPDYDEYGPFSGTVIKEEPMEYHATYDWDPPAGADLSVGTDHYDLQAEVTKQ